MNTTEIHDVVARILDGQEESGFHRDGSWSVERQGSRLLVSIWDTTDWGPPNLRADVCRGVADAVQSIASLFDVTL